jgi:dTDP-3-amino-2,3,6-trideoxy-4-keto-D-glucose/dTDP-3-amino-3,4,6-trideoxy-alpha-D-glucose/dTDP-2,6-dideoxy-D-kanosamine transaminase
MANFYPQQYQETGTYPINHNYLPQQFADMDEIWQKVREVVVKGDFTLGGAVDTFEQQFARLNGGKYGIGVGSGTDALFLSLKALGIGEGDEVITTPYTFFATIGAIVTAGATPVFVDAAPDFNIDVNKIEGAITSQTRAIMPVHWSGNPCDMAAINQIASQHNIAIVADACHAISATLNGKGVAEFSELTCFSMHPLKNLNVWGDGGVIVTNNKELADNLYLIRNHGLKSRDICQQFSYNSRLDTIQAVVAQHLLDNKLSNITAARISHARYMDEALQGLPQVQLPHRSPHKKAVYHLYMGLFEQRDQLQFFLQKQGIDAKVHYPVPMHLQPAAKALGYQAGDFPVAEHICNRCLSLPVHEYIQPRELEFMVSSISAFYEGA